MASPDQITNAQSQLHRTSFPSTSTPMHQRMSEEEHMNSLNHVDPDHLLAQDESILQEERQEERQEESRENDNIY